MNYDYIAFLYYFKGTFKEDLFYEFAISFFLYMIIHFHLQGEMNLLS